MHAAKVQEWGNVINVEMWKCGKCGNEYSTLTD
jgi:hypothetical protein